MKLYFLSSALLSPVVTGQSLFEGNLFCNRGGDDDGDKWDFCAPRCVANSSECGASFDESNTPCLFLCNGDEVDGFFSEADAVYPRGTVCSNMTDGISVSTDLVSGWGFSEPFEGECAVAGEYLLTNVTTDSANVVLGISAVFTDVGCSVLVDGEACNECIVDLSTRPFQMIVNCTNLEGVDELHTVPYGGNIGYLFLMEDENVTDTHPLFGLTFNASKICIDGEFLSNGRRLMSGNPVLDMFSKW